MKTFSCGVIAWHNTSILLGQRLLVTTRQMNLRQWFIVTIVYVHICVCLCLKAARIQSSSCNTTFTFRAELAFSFLKNSVDSTRKTCLLESVYFVKMQALMVLQTAQCLLSKQLCTFRLKTLSWKTLLFCRKEAYISDFL